MPNKRRLLITAVTILAAASLSGELAVGSAAPAAPRSSLQLGTTLHLVSQPARGANLDATHLVLTAVLNNQGSSKTVGAASYTCVQQHASGGGTLSCKGALAFRGGILIITDTLNDKTSKITGKVQGGNGSYSGAYGDVSGRYLGKGKESLTITYSVS